MVTHIKIINKYNGEDCYLDFIYSKPVVQVQICDKDGNHIDDHYLFSFHYIGMDLDFGVASDIYLTPCVDTDDDNGSLIIVGVDEI